MGRVELLGVEPGEGGGGGLLEKNYSTYLGGKLRCW